MKKKLLVFLAMVFSVLFLVACGGTKEEAKREPFSTPEYVL